MKRTLPALLVLAVVLACGAAHAALDVRARPANRRLHRLLPLRQQEVARRHTRSPTDRSRWGAFDIIGERNDGPADRGSTRRAQGAASSPPAARQRKVDGVLRERHGPGGASSARALKPLAPLLEAIGRIAEPRRSRRTVVASCSNRGIKAGFTLRRARPTRRTRRRYLAEITQGGLGLPDRDYYFRDDERTQQIRDAYPSAHREGASSCTATRRDAEAANRPRTVCDFETELAQRLDDRGGAPRPSEDLQHDDGRGARSRSRPAFRGSAYFDAIGARNLARVNVAQPAYFPPSRSRLAAPPSSRRNGRPTCAGSC